MITEVPKSNDCDGFYAIIPLQTASQKEDQTVAVTVKSRKPVKDWQPPMKLWYCGNFGQKKGKPRQYCSHQVNDDYGLRNASSRCLMCRERGRILKERHWASTMIRDARSGDKKRLAKPEDRRPFTEIDWDRYITKAHVMKLYKISRGLCWWCGIHMNKRRRDTPNGLTIDRLTDQPHYINTCVLSCSRCNCTSWRKDRLTSYFMGRPSGTLDKLLVFQTYLLWWELNQRVLLELDFQPH